MAFNPGLVDQLTGWTRDYGIKPGASVLDIGTSELHCVADPEAINRFLVSFGAQPYPGAELAKIANRGFAAGLFRRAGFGYLAIDIADHPDTLRLDLNRHQLPASGRGRFALVLNCGTTEHVLNQYNAFKVIHDAAEVGGVMYHGLPMGDLAHGLINYNPRFFQALADANGYEVLGIWGWVSDEPKPFTDIQMTKPHAPHSTWVHVLLRRRTRAAFVTPLDHVGY